MMTLDADGLSGLGTREGSGPRDGQFRSSETSLHLCKPLRGAVEGIPAEAEWRRGKDHQEPQRDDRGQRHQ